MIYLKWRLLVISLSPIYDILSLPSPFLKSLHALILKFTLWPWLFPTSALQAMSRPWLNGFSDCSHFTLPMAMSPPCCIKKWRINREIIIPPKTTLEKDVNVSAIVQVLYKKQTVRKHSDKVKHYQAQWCGWCETTLTGTPSFWCHTRVWVPIVAVGTKNSSVRLCVAYIKLILQTIKDA